VRSGSRRPLPMTEGMTKILASLGILATLAFTGTASAASVAVSGNFHVAAGAVGCRFVEYGPVSADLGSAATIRCERYSDHTFISMSTSGKITETHSGTKVQPGTVGHSGSWFHRYVWSVGCQTGIGYFGKPAVTCWHGSKSFIMGPGGVNIYR
jgi:hypothetical protein